MQQRYSNSVEWKSVIMNLVSEQVWKGIWPCDWNCSSKSISIWPFSSIVLLEPRKVFPVVRDIFTYVAFSGPVWSCYICIAWDFGASFHSIGKVYMTMSTTIYTTQIVVVLWGFFLFYIITYNIYRTTVCETFQNAHSNSY